MTIMNKLTLRFLKQNKRRTLVTILGVVISVAMITAVLTIGTSFINMMQRQAINDYGEWHLKYGEMPAASLETLKKAENVEKVSIEHIAGVAYLEGAKSPNKPYWVVREWNKEAFEHLPLKLVEGRLPDKPGEVLISKGAAEGTTTVYGIGDTLTVEPGVRVTKAEAEYLAKNEAPNASFGEIYWGSSIVKDEDGQISDLLVQLQPPRTYTVVGISQINDIEKSTFAGYTLTAYLDESSLDANEQLDAYVLASNLDNMLLKKISNLNESIGAEYISHNNSLLRYYGLSTSFNRVIVPLIAIIMTVIMAGSISLIYNAFAISVSERSRQLGMLSSIGATKRQKRNSVFFEAFVISCLSIPVGLLAGLAGMWVTFYVINNAISNVFDVSVRLKVFVPPYMLAIAVAISLLTIFLSAYLPAIRASKYSAIEAIRQVPDVKLTKKAVRTNKLVRLLFGFEAEIALKNLKRNKRRYQATVFSIMISIVLFLSVSYLSDGMKGTLKISQADEKFDIMLVKPMGEFSEAFSSELGQQAEIESVLQYISLSGMTKINVANLTKNELELVDSSFIQDGELEYRIELLAMPQAQFDEFLQSNSLQLPSNDGNQPYNGILVNGRVYYDQEQQRYRDTKIMEQVIGEVFSIHGYAGGRGDENLLGDVRITAVSSRTPNGASQAGQTELQIVIPIDTLHQMKEAENEDYQSLVSHIHIKSSDPIRTQELLDEAEGEVFHSFNSFAERRKQEQTILVLEVFMYGFILLIVAISTANIFNTISTSIMLRKREFAMLKSVGMTPGGFNRMIRYESIFYGMKALLYGLPISFVVMYCIYRVLRRTYDISYSISWLSLGITIAAVFLIVGSSMLYVGSKVKRDHIVEAIKQENI